MSESPVSREDQIAGIAGQFLSYIDIQTGIAPPHPDDVEPDGLFNAISALDSSLDQLADLADVYSADRMQSIEPLVLPAAALIGEYLRSAAGAVWLEPEIDADATLVIAITNGVAVDLTGAVRASLMTGQSNLRLMAGRLLDPETS